MTETEVESQKLSEKLQSSPQSILSSYQSLTPAPDTPKASVILVTAPRHHKDKALINDFFAVTEAIMLPSSVTELLASQPGLDSNGQPGIFQTVNIRGLAGQRVQAYVNGMRITSERRAGVAASFIDPMLLSGVEVTQGPASTYYGSGAIGGTIHLQTRQDSGLWANVGYKSDGDEWLTAFGNGDENYSAGVAIRQRENGETIDGDPKNNHFSQLSVNYQRHVETDIVNLDWQLIYSKGDDIGKDNLRYPSSRITRYPGEDHLLLQLVFSGKDDWLGRLYMHDQQLITQDIRPQNRINEVTTQSTDLGWSLENQWMKGSYGGMYGIDYFARRGVDSVERQTDIATQTISEFVGLLDGKENEAAVFATINRSIEDWSFHGGVRANYQSQDSRGSEPLTDEFLTYFVTATRTLGDFELSMSYGTGFRFASLSERLFSGTTGRGQTLGNPALQPEESESIDFGVRYENLHWNIELHRFGTNVDKFIHQVSLDAETKSFRNVTSGGISGWQYQVSYNVLNDSSSSFGFDWYGQRITGEDNLGDPLSDIPPESHRLAVHYEQGSWYNRLSYNLRLAKYNPGDGEVSLAQANIATFKTGYLFDRHSSLELVVDNLLDEFYFNSADDLATLASGRSFSVNFAYRP